MVGFDFAVGSHGGVLFSRRRLEKLSFSGGFPAPLSRRPGLWGEELRQARYFVLLGVFIEV